MDEAGEVVIPVQYWIAIVTAIFAVGTGIGFIKGREHGLEKYYELKAVVEQKEKQATADADTARRQLEQVSTDVSNAWNRALTHIRNNPPVRVLPGTRCDSTGLRAGTATIPDGVAAPDVIDSSYSLTAEQCEARLNDGVADAAQLYHLQEWLRGAREAAK